MAPTTKLGALRAAWASGDYRAALRIAARFPRLGDHAETISRGWAAVQNPQFYRDIGQDPDGLVAAAYAALAVRYDLPAAV